MSTINYVHIFVDCEQIAVNPSADPAKVIQMFASPDIVLDGTNGSNELSIKVYNQDEIRWLIFPKSPSGSPDIYSVIVDARHDWTTSNAMLTDWQAYQGEMSVRVYDPDGQTMNQDADVVVTRKAGFMPYVEAHASLPGRPDPGFTSKPEAYTFFINIYKGDQDTPVVSNYSWDPFVTIVQP